MENVKDEVIIEPELLEEKDFTSEELEDDNTDWKAKALELKGLNKRRATKLGKLKEVYSKIEPKSAPENKPNPEKPKEGFDYAELAYITAKGISDEDVSFVEETVKNTGKQLKDLLGTKWFQTELQERKEERITKEAIPIGSKRSGSSSKDSKDYWISQIDSGKAKLSDIQDVSLRREVNNARIQSEENKSKFASNSVIIGGQG